MSKSEVVDVSEFVAHDRALDRPATPTAGGAAAVSASDLHESAQPATAPRNVVSSFSEPEPQLPSHLKFQKSPFWQEYERRVREQQDLVILVSDYENDRGTGKTTLSIDLSEKLDRTDEGLIPEKAAIAPEELINGYTAHPRQSALILDEAEAGVGAREAMTRINRTMIEIVSMGRVEEKYLVLNMPASNHIDKNLIDLAHFWILVQEKGTARVYQLNNNPFEQKSYPTPVQQLEWSDIDSRNPVYRELSKEKQERLNAPGQGNSERFVELDEHEEALEKARQQARREERDAIIRRALQHPRLDASQGVIGDIADVSQTHVSNVKQEAQRAGETPTAADD